MVNVSKKYKTEFVRFKNVIPEFVKCNSNSTDIIKRILQGLIKREKRKEKKQNTVILHSRQK